MIRSESDMNIPLTKPYWGAKEYAAITRAMKQTTGAGDGENSAALSRSLRLLLPTRYAFPVSSCTHALELAVRIVGIGPGDEVIVPSFTMTSTANAVLLSGATPVFADIDPNTYCIDPVDVESCITKKTKAIIVVHYAGMGCDMDAFRRIAKRHSLVLIEDAAHAIGSQYEDQSLGTIGDIGAFSFHGTKNISCGEGGAIVTDKKSYAQAIDVFRANGTNRSEYIQGLVSAYYWVGAGSSYFLSDILASVVVEQLKKMDIIIKRRSHIARIYSTQFAKWTDVITVPIVSVGTTLPNWHIYAVRFRKSDQSARYIDFMRKNGVVVSYHYAPLHTSPMGKYIHKRVRPLPTTERVSRTLVRLPIYPDASERQISYICRITEEWMKHEYNSRLTNFVSE